MIELNWTARLLGWQLGLGDLNHQPACMHYANACVCQNCQDRSTLKAKSRTPPAQPWEAKPAA